MPLWRQLITWLLLVIFTSQSVLAFSLPQPTTYRYDGVTDRLLLKSADLRHPSLSLAHAPATMSYEYDTLGRRTVAQVRNLAGDLLHTQSWAFDTRDRMVTHTQSQGTVNYTYDTGGLLTSTALVFPPASGLIGYLVLDGRSEAALLGLTIASLALDSLMASVSLATLTARYGI
jgi:YD repeat-containing protein